MPSFNSGLAAFALLTTVLNRLMFRFALVPMCDLTHLFAIITNVFYVAFFGTIIYSKSSQKKGGFAVEFEYALYGSGRYILALAGFAECIGFITMPLFARNMPGSMLPVIAQSMVPFSMCLSYVLLGKNYDYKQILGVLYVLVGIGFCTFAKDAEIHDHVISSAHNMRRGPSVEEQLAKADREFVWKCFGLFSSYFFISSSFVLKELAFNKFRVETKVTFGAAVSPLNLVMNLVTAMWQGLLLWVLWPINFQYLTPLTPSQYFAKAWVVLTTGGDILVIMIYLLANVMYLVTTVMVIRQLSAANALLIGAAAVPIVAVTFCFNWTGVGQEPFSGWLICGLAVIFGGVLLFNHTQLHPPKRSSSNQTTPPVALTIPRRYGSNQTPR